MSTIDDLNQSISSMSDEELINLLKQVRASRRVTKKTTKTQNATTKKSTTPPKNLSSAAMAALIKELEEEIR